MWHTTWILYRLNTAPWWMHSKAAPWDPKPVWNLIFRNLAPSVGQMVIVLHFKQGKHQITTQQFNVEGEEEEKDFICVRWILHWQLNVHHTIRHCFSDKHSFKLNLFLVLYHYPSVSQKSLIYLYIIIYLNILYINHLYFLYFSGSLFVSKEMCNNQHQ